MAALVAYDYINKDSGRPTILHPNFNPKIKNWTPPDPPHKEFSPPKDRAFFADPSKPNLLSSVELNHLTESIGTEIRGAQLSQFTPTQLDELALLVNERGVVFFRNQDLTTPQQEAIFAHYGILDTHPAQADVKHVVIRGSSEDYRDMANFTPWPRAGWHADTSFEINPPSYSLLRMEEHPSVGGDTTWISQYGLYDVLSDNYERLFEGLHAIHTSRLQYDTLIDGWGSGARRPPLDSHHPAIRTHPVTGLKAFNVNEGFVTGFAELKKPESDSLLDFSFRHIHSADDHAVRWRWEVGSIALWDNRATIHRVIPGRYEAGKRRGIRTTVFGEKPYYDPKSEGRLEREQRLAQEATVNGRNAVNITNGNGANGTVVNATDVHGRTPAISGQLYSNDTSKSAGNNEAASKASVTLDERILSKRLEKRMLFPYQRRMAMIPKLETEVPYFRLRIALTDFS